MVCLLSLGFTLVRETFNTWTPSFFTEDIGLTKAQAAHIAALFPFFGGLAVIAAGVVSDRLGRGGRSLIILCTLPITCLALFILGSEQHGIFWLGPVALVCAIGFLMIGPYSYLAGAISLDFGGKQGSATTCGIIDGVGYLGAVLAGGSIARISKYYGWSGAFQFLGGVTAVACIVAAFYWLDQRRPIPSPIEAKS